MEDWETIHKCRRRIDAMSHLAIQRKIYIAARHAETLQRIEMGEPIDDGLLSKAMQEASEIGKQEGIHQTCCEAAQALGGFVECMPPYPYIMPEGDTRKFWESHDPDDWRQWSDIPEEYAGMDWETNGAGFWMPVSPEPETAQNERRKDHDANTLEAEG